MHENLKQALAKIAKAINEKYRKIRMRQAKDPPPLKKK
jgi:hypothetical protein